MEADTRAETPAKHSLMTRREFIIIGGSVSIASLALAEEFDAYQRPPTFVARVRRDFDLIDLEIAFIGFREKDGYLVPYPGRRAAVAVHFPPQNLAEAIFPEVPGGATYELAPLETEPKDPNANSPVPPVRNYISGTSRLVFDVPEGARVPLRVTARQPKEQQTPAGYCDELLAPSLVDSWFALLARWSLRLPSKMTAPKFDPHIPGIDETCLELPYRLLIAPRFAQTRWLTTSEKMPFDRPVPATTELWNAELISRTKLLPAKPKDDFSTVDPNLAPLKDVTLQATAVFSPDYNNQGNEPAIGDYFPGNQPLSLRCLTRHLLIKQMSEGNGWIDVDHLVLTALGSDSFLAYFNQTSFEEIFCKQIKVYNKKGLKGIGDPKKPEDAVNAKNAKAFEQTLAVWKHRIVVGRDVYMVEAMVGALFPMVHPAVHVTLTQRKYVSRSQANGAAGPPGAYLLQREYIVIRKPEQSFTDSENPLGRSMPTKSVVLGWTQTPDLVFARHCPITNDLAESDPKKKAELLPSRLLVYVPRPITQINLVDQTGKTNPGKPLQWPVSFTDESGRQSKTNEACLLFASNVIAGHVAWQNLKPEYRKWPVPAQLIGLAPEKVAIVVPRAADASVPPKPYELKPAELDGASRLGEALATWRSADPDVTFAIPPVATNLNAWATLEAVQRLIRPVWEITKELPQKFDEFVKESLLKADVFVNKLATSYRTLLKQARDQINDFDTVVGKVEGEVNRLLASMQRIEAASLQAVDRGLATIQNLKKDRDKAFREFQSLLSGAEKVSAALETHAITFGSRLVEQLYNPAKGLVANLEKEGKKIQEAPRVFIDKAKNEVTNLFDKKAEYKELHDAMQRELKALEAITDDNQLKRLTQQYYNQLQNAQKQVTALGTNLFHAVVEEVRGIIPSMKAIVPGYEPEKIALTTDYLARGIREVEQGIFAEVQRTEQEIAKVNQLLAKKVDAIKNGLATPRALIQGLSTQLGAVAADGAKQLEKMAREKLADITDGLDFKNAIPSAKLFGAIELFDLIGKLGAGQLPSINLVKTPELLQHTWKWTIPIAKPGSEVPFGVLTWKNVNPERANPKQVCLHLEIVTTARLPKPEEALKGKKPEGNARLDAYIGHFDIKRDQPTPPTKGSASFALELLSLIRVNVRQVRIGAEYAIGSAPTPRIKPEVEKIEFLGPMRFVETLQDMLGGLFGGIKPELSPTHLNLTLSIGLPPISFGFFSLRNIRLGVGLMLPFGDDPLRFRFNFATFEQPFELTVLCFGGRGFIRTEIDTRGGRLLEGALEFGGSLAFDVGVASGGLYVMAGFYFRITQAQTMLSGYIRAGGNLNVLGLIHASVEFMLSMAYRSLVANGRHQSELYGSCTITVSISLFMFSIDVSISMEKRIAGSDGPVTADGQALLAAPDESTFVAFRPGAEAKEEEPAQPMPQRMAYFAQHGPKEIPGRFPWNNHRPHESARQWVDEYWSQFDFSKR